MSQWLGVTPFLIWRLNSRVICHPLCTHHSHTPQRAPTGIASFWNLLELLSNKSTSLYKSNYLLQNPTPQQKQGTLLSKGKKETKVTLILSLRGIPETWIPRNLNTNIKLISFTQQESKQHAIRYSPLQEMPWLSITCLQIPQILDFLKDLFLNVWDLEDVSRGWKQRQ